MSEVEKIEENKEYEKPKCVGCDEQNEDFYMFKVDIYDQEKKEVVEEWYCSNCLATILTETPEDIVNVEAE